MDNIYVIRGRIEELYGKHSKLFDKAFQFILAMITFSMINQNTGFMKSLSSPVISLALAVVATFLPPMVIVVIAAVLVLAHTLAASIGIFAVSAMIFLIMYIFYIRLAPKMAFVVLLTPIAFVLKIPFLVPVACALIYTPVSLVPISCGTVVFYMVEYLKKTSSRATVVKLFKRSGKLHVTVGYIPTTSTDDSIINVSSDTPTKYMDYLFERQSGSWYLTGLTESETKAESTESTPAANVPEPMAESDVQDAILAAAGSDSASAEADSTAADEGVDTQAEEQPADSTEAQADESTASPAA